MHARIDGRQAKLLTRTGLDWSHRYRRTIDALGALRVKTAYERTKHLDTGATVMSGGAGRIGWLVFVVCLVVFGSGPLTTALDDANRYADVQESHWFPTNWWIKSAQCARERGVWLSICEGDKLVPMSERSFGDDPGHALFLGIWTIATHDAVSLVDVARLNTWLNAAGLAIPHPGTTHLVV
jgi:hypothetical protein